MLDVNGPTPASVGLLSIPSDHRSRVASGHLKGVPGAPLSITAVRTNKNVSLRLWDRLAPNLLSDVFKLVVYLFANRNYEKSDYF